jgi:hypothetical protein
MDPDLNKYDLNHVTTAHQIMTKAEFEKVYADAWNRYYTIDHVETIMRRAVVSGIATSNVLLLAVWFMGALKIEKVHPLEVGFVRKKSRLNRRHGMKIEPAIIFYPKYYVQLAWKMSRWALLYLRFGLARRRVEKTADKLAYTDHAMTPVTDHEEQDFELFKTADALAYLNQEKRIERAQHGDFDQTAAE